MQRSAGNLRHTSVLIDAITTEWRQRRRRAHRLLNMATTDTKWKNKGDNIHYLRSIWRWFLNKLLERSTSLSLYMINEAFSSYLPSLLPIYRGNRRYKSPFLQHKLQRRYWDTNQKNASKWQAFQETHCFPCHIAVCFIAVLSSTAIWYGYCFGLKK